MSLFTAMFIMAPRRQREQIIQGYALMVMLAFLFVCIIIVSDYLNGTLTFENGDKFGDKVEM